MQILTKELALEQFFEQVTRAPQRALLLDYDGTLAPFRMERMEAVPYPGVRDRLHELLEAGHSRVILISGRMVEEVKQLSGLSHAVEIWGAHGWERLMPDGRFELAPMQPEMREALDDAADFVIASRLQSFSERKPASVAFHTRPLWEDGGEEGGRLVQEEWERIAADAGMTVEVFDGGFELRAPGRDKGVAVRTILSELNPESAVAYLGDDRTDEDAFRVLRQQRVALNHIGVVVREVFRPTEADLWIEPPGEMLSFIDRWIKAGMQ